MTKKLLKTSGYISFVMAGAYLFSFMLIHLCIPYYYLVEEFYGYMPILLLAICSLLSAFGGIIFLQYIRLDDDDLNTKKNYIFSWSIVLLLVCSISGVFALLAYLHLTEINKDNKLKYIEELKELEKLRKKGIITVEDFNKKKKKLLDI